MMIKRIFCAFMSIVSAAVFCSCGSNSTQDKTKIAVITKAGYSDFWHNVKKGVNAAATEYNVSVTFDGPDSEDDYITQNKMIEDAVKDGANAIVLSAINYYKSENAVNDAVKSGVKVITIDSDVNSPLVSMFIGTDNYEAGKQAGIAAEKTRKKGEKLKIGLINYDAQTDNGARREQGFREYVSGIENAEIIDFANVVSDTSVAEAAAEKMLKAHPEINILIGFNELMTVGIGNAIKRLNLAGRVKSVGFDTNVSSLSMIEDGDMNALIVQNPYAIGYLGIKNTADILSGKTAVTEKKYINTSVTTVTKDNLFDEDIQKTVFPFS